MLENYLKIARYEGMKDRIYLHTTIRSLRLHLPLLHFWALFLLSLVLAE